MISIWKTQHQTHTNKNYAQFAIKSFVHIGVRNTVLHRVVELAKTKCQEQSIIVRKMIQSTYENAGRATTTIGKQVALRKHAKRGLRIIVISSADMVLSIIMLTLSGLRRKGRKLNSNSGGCLLMTTSDLLKHRVVVVQYVKNRVALAGNSQSTTTIKQAGLGAYCVVIAILVLASFLIIKSYFGKRLAIYNIADLQLTGIIG